MILLNPRKFLSRRACRVAVFLIVAAFAAMSTARATSDWEWYDYFDEAVESCRVEDYERCVELMEIALEFNPESGTHVVGAGRVVSYYPHWYLCDGYTKLEDAESARCHCEGGDAEYARCVERSAPEDDELEKDGDGGSYDGPAFELRFSDADDEDEDAVDVGDDAETQDEGDGVEEDESESVVSSAPRKRRKPGASSGKKKKSSGKVEKDEAADEPESAMAARIAEMRGKAPKNAANPEGEELADVDTDFDETGKAIVVAAVVYASVEAEKNRKAKEKEAARREAQKKKDKKRKAEAQKSRRGAPTFKVRCLDRRYTLARDKNYSNVKFFYTFKAAKGEMIKKILLDNKTVCIVTSHSRKRCDQEVTYFEQKRPGKYEIFIEAWDTNGKKTRERIKFEVANSEY